MNETDKPTALNDIDLDDATGGFSGPSGTGKTLSADLLGRRTGGVSRTAESPLAKRQLGSVESGSDTKT